MKIRHVKKLNRKKPKRREKKRNLELMMKRLMYTGSLRLVDESVVEGIHEKEPIVDDEEADVQRALEESLKTVQGKGKEKVIDEQVARDLLTLQTPKKKSPGDQFIFQRRTSTPTGSSGHDESSLLYVKLGLTDSEVESNEDVLGIDAGVQGEGQAGPNLDDQDEGQAGPNPDEQDDGKAGPNPGYATASQPLSSLVVHTGPNLKHMDLEVTEVSTQPHPKQMDKGFTAMAYPKVQENLKLTVEEQVILEEPASSTGTSSSLQHLMKDLSFGDLFFNDKPSEADNEKTTAETEVESMVSVTIQQDTSSISPMTTPVSKAVDEIVTDAVDWAIQAPLQNCFRDLPKADMKEIIHQRMWDTNSYKTHEDHMILYEALEKSMNRDHFEELLKYLAEAHKKKKKRRYSPKTSHGSLPHQPPPPPPPAVPSGNSRSLGAFGSLQVPLPPPSTNQEDLQMDDDMALDAQEHSSDNEDIGNAHIPKVNLWQDWWKPLKEDRPATPEPAWFIPSSDVPVLKNKWASALASTYSPPPKDSLLVQTGDMAMFMDWFCKRQGITELKPQDLKGPTFELVNVFHPNVIHLQYQMEEYHKLLTDSMDGSIIRHNVSKPLPLGGLPGQVTIQSDFFFNKDLEYLRYGSKGSRPVLSISKMKVAYYPDVSLEQMVPDQMWIEEECKYDITAMYGISHWCFQRQRFYIDRHTSEGDRRAVRTHMKILSVVRIEVFSMYGYVHVEPSTPPEPPTTQRQEDSHYCSQPMDQTLGYSIRVEDFQLGIESYQTQLNLTKPLWDATVFAYKHDYTIDEALDYRVKEFKANKINPGLNTRFWTRKDMDRSKEFMFTIQKRLKTRRIFCNLESFIG
nr:hypothetical protein [Tanacetum cinerariifolium]